MVCTQYTSYAEGVFVVNVVTVISKNFQCRHRLQAFAPSCFREGNEAKIGSQKKCNPFKATELNNLVFTAVFLVTLAMRCVPMGISHPWLA